MSKKLSKMGLIISFIFVAVTVVNAGDSTHTRGENSMEHPMEHPEDGASAYKVDKDAMAMAIMDFIDHDSKLKGGFFMFYDTKDKAPLVLTLDKVHKERLAQVGENLYFACSDFKEASGTMYDLDFFMKDDGESLVVTEVMVHKKAGNARYTWHEEEGMWSTKAVK